MTEDEFFNFMPFPYAAMSKASALPANMR